MEAFIQSATSTYCTHLSAGSPRGNQPFNQESEHKNALLGTKCRKTQTTPSPTKATRNKYDSNNNKKNATLQ